MKEKIFIASDHAGYDLKNSLVSHFKDLFDDLGAQNEHPPASCILPAFDISSWKNAIMKINNERISQSSDRRSPREDLILAASVYSARQVSNLHSQAYSKALELKK